MKKRQKQLKMVNHFILRIVKPDKLGLITSTPNMINHVIERVASVISRVSPVRVILFENPLLLPLLTFYCEGEPS